MSTIQAHPHPLVARVPAPWRTHHRRLLALRESLVHESAVHAEEAADPLEPHHLDQADSATDAYDHDMSLGILTHQTHALHEIDDAIARIHAGTYGICERTGKPIPAARLNIVPWTRYTREALEKIERNQRDPRQFLARPSSLQGSPPGGLPDSPDPAAEERMNRKTARLTRTDSLRDQAGDRRLTPTRDEPSPP